MALWTYCILVGVAVLTAGTFRPEIVYSTASAAVLFCYALRVARSTPGGARWVLHAENFMLATSCRTLHAGRRPTHPGQGGRRCLVAGAPRLPPRCCCCGGVGRHPSIPPLVPAASLRVLLQVSRAVFAWGLHLLVLKVMLYALGLSAAVPTLELAAYAGYPFTAASTSLVSHLAFGERHHPPHVPCPPLYTAFVCCSGCRVGCAASQLDGPATSPPACQHTLASPPVHRVVAPQLPCLALCHRASVALYHRLFHQSLPPVPYCPCRQAVVPRCSGVRQPVHGHLPRAIHEASDLPGGTAVQ